MSQTLPLYAKANCRKASKFHHNVTFMAGVRETTMNCMQAEPLKRCVAKYRGQIELLVAAPPSEDAHPTLPFGWICYPAYTFEMIWL